MAKDTKKKRRIWEYDFVLNTFLPSKIALPDALIIGAQKAATSSLFYYLTQHPAIKGSRYKEVHFFDRETRYRRGVSWYKRQFPRRGDAEVLLEATPNYIYRPKVAQRISRLRKEFKFIVTLRDPLNRALSAYNMYRKKEKDENYKALTKIMDANNEGFRMHEVLCRGALPSFEALVEMELQWMEEGNQIVEPSIVRQGFYAEHIRRWRRHFRREQFLFLRMSDLQYPAIVQSLKAVEQFLGLQSDFDWESINYERKNVVDPNLQTRPIDPALERRLRGLFRKKNKGLEALTGLHFDWLTEPNDPAPEQKQKEQKNN